MVAKLSRQDAPGAAASGFFGRRAPETQAESPQPTVQAPRPHAEARSPVQPRGWASPATTTPENAPTPAQRTEALLRTGEVIAPAAEAVGMAHFSQAVRDQAETVAKGPWPDAPPVTLKVTDAAEVQVNDTQAAPPKTVRSRAKKADTPPFATAPHIAHEVKLGILQLAFTNPETTLEDGLEIADIMLEFIERA